MEKLAGAKEAELAQNEDGYAASRRPQAAGPPKKVIVDDNEPSEESLHHKKKARPAKPVQHSAARAGACIRLPTVTLLTAFFILSGWELLTCLPESISGYRFCSPA